MLAYVGEITLDFPTYRRIVQAPAGPRVWIVTTLGLIETLLGILMIAVIGPNRSTVAIVLLGLFFLSYREIAVLIGWQQTRRLTTRPWRYEITSSTVGIHTPETDVRIQFAGVSRARITRHAWVFVVAATRRPVIVPRAAFGPTAQHEIDAFVRDFGRRPAATAA